MVHPKVYLHGKAEHRLHFAFACGGEDGGLCELCVSVCVWVRGLGDVRGCACTHMARLGLVLALLRSLNTQFERGSHGALLMKITQNYLLVSCSASRHTGRAFRTRPPFPSGPQRLIRHCPAKRECTLRPVQHFLGAPKLARVNEHPRKPCERERLCIRSLAKEPCMEGQGCEGLGGACWRVAPSRASECVGCSLRAAAKLAFASRSRPAA